MRRKCRDLLKKGDLEWGEMQKNIELGEFLPVAGADRAAVFHRETPSVSCVKRPVDQIEMG